MIDTNPKTTVAAQLAALPSMSMTELWALWDEHFPRRPGHRNRHYIESRLAYRIQELAYGALPKPIRRMLVEAGAKHSKIKTAVGRSAQTLLMPGTTLIREWEEREFRVTVTPDGLYALNGHRCRLFPGVQPGQAVGCDRHCHTAKSAPGACAGGKVRCAGGELQGRRAGQVRTRL
jgi:hypothetical protein